MREALLHYYERELGYVRRMGAEFAQRYPKIAGRLLLEPTKCEDPHVERLLEAFAFLAARVHLRLDDDFPEISGALLDIVYPHFVRPLPSMSVVELRLDPEQGKVTSGFRVKRDATLFSRAVDGVPCRFRTCYDTTLWPVSVTAAQWLTPDRLKPAMRIGDAVAALRVELRCAPDVTFSQLDLSTLRLHLHGEGSLTAALYELLCNNARSVIVREIAAPGATAAPKSLTLPASSLRPAGFAQDEGMLPYPGRAFEGYRLLQEYFAFPDKFLFIDVAGLEATRAAGMGSAVELIVPVAAYERADWRPMLEAGVTAATVRLGCTPAVNLFSHVSEPILVSHRRTEYDLVADARRRLTTDIFSVDEVMGVTPGESEVRRYEPFYAVKLGNGARSSGISWMARRRPSGWRTDAAADVTLSFVNAAGSAASPDRDVVTARLTCFNGDLPSRLPFGDETGDFELDGGGPLRGIVALVKPTPVIHPPLDGPQLWRLVSLLSLNYLSLVDGGAEALRELLRLHEFAGSPSALQQISGIRSVRSGPGYARVATEHGLTFARGRRVELELDEEQFAGGGIYLFASVLEQFLALYSSLNSFSVLHLKARQRRSVVREWPARAGWKPLL